MKSMRIAASALFLISVCYTATSFAADQARTQSTVHEVTIRGHIADDKGDPIEDARVHLVGKYFRTGLPHTFPGSLTVRTDDGGNFNAAFPQSDRRFRQQESLLVVIEAANKQSRFVDWKHVRSYANQPLNVALKSVESLPVRIVDASGDPLENVRVSPAKVATHLIPYAAWHEAETTTDQNGIALIPGVTLSNLRMVYAVSAGIGHQCLNVDLTADRSLQAVALATSLESGRLRLPKSENPDSKNPQSLAPEGIQKTALNLVTLAGETDGSPFAWCRAEVDSNGEFSECRLSRGKLRFVSEFPDDFPFTVDINAAYSSSLPPKGEPIEILLEPGTRVVGKLIRSDTGAPIPDIYIDHHDRTGRSSFSDGDGGFQFWAGKSRIGYYPSDVFEQFSLAGAFYLYPQKLPQDGRLELDPVQLQPCSSATGIVVDEKGAPVAGARVQCSFKRERFTYDQTFYTNSDGKFAFHGISDGTGVSISAQSTDRISQSPVSLALTDDSEAEIVISPRHAVLLKGRVVDYVGRPLVGAAVRVRYSKTHQKEAYSGRDGQMTDMLLGAEPIETDPQGFFVSQPILDWDRPVSIAVDLPGQRPLRTYLADLTAAGNQKQDVEFGELVMRPSAQKLEVTFRVVAGDTDESIDGAKLVVLGARTPRTAAMTDATGAATVAIVDAPQLLGVQAAGYLPSVGILPTASGTKVIRLRPNSETPSERSPVEPTDADLKRSASQLVAKLPALTDEASVHRQRMALYCLAFADFDAATDKLRDAADSNLSNMLGPFIAGLEWLDRKQLDRVMEYVDARGQVFIHLRNAARTEDTEHRDELIGEAIVLAREVSGDDHAYTVAQISETLLNIGESDLAKELMADSWQEHGELSAVLEKGERIKKAGIARVFAPPYALVDPDAAMKLIELTAFANEIERLQTKALVYLALFAPDKFREQCELRGITELSSLGINQFYGRLEVKDLSRGLAIAKLVPASPGKAQFLYDLMKNANDATPQQRTDVARQMLDVMLKQSPEASTTNTSELAAKAAVLVSKWDRQLAEEFVFASLWLCENEGTILPFNLTSRLASELALYDAELARVLVEPVFEDWSWLFEARDANVIFTRNMPLAAAAAIDPEWAVELAEQLFDDHLQGNPSRKFETAYGIIDQWSKLPTR